MQTPNASENPILKLCRAQHTTRRVLFAATAVSLYPFPSFFFLSSTKQPLPARSHGILSTLPKRNKTPSHFLWHSVQSWRILPNLLKENDCLLIHSCLVCLWKCQRNTFRRQLALIWITFQKVSILPKFPGIDTSQKNQPFLQYFCNFHLRFLPKPLSNKNKNIHKCFQMP